MPVTRFGLEGYGVRRAGSFAGKTPDSGAGPHPVGILTRFGLDGYGVRRAGDFSGKTTATPTPTPTGQVGTDGARWPLRKKLKARKPRPPIYRHPEEVERERRMVEEYLDVVERKPTLQQRVGEEPEPAPPPVVRLTEAITRIATMQQLERIAKAAGISVEDREKAEKEQRRRRAAATAVLMMSH